MEVGFSEDQPRQVDGCARDFEFSKGLPTHMRGVYLGNIDDMRVCCHSAPVEGLNHLLWYDFSVKENNPYLLQVHPSSFIDFSSPTVFTEEVDDTLETWLDKHKNGLLTNDYRLRSDLQLILLDVISGLSYLRTNLGRQHGNLFSWSIFIVKGRAKLGWLGDPKIEKMYDGDDDVDSFRSLLEGIFLGLLMPGEVLHMYNILKAPQSKTPLAFSTRFFYFDNCVKHPALLSREQKCRYRHYALVAINAENWRYVSFQAYDWRLNVVAGPYQSVLLYDSKQRPLPRNYYNEYALGFLKFCRDAYEHRYDHGLPLEVDVIDKDLEDLYPLFLCYLHYVLLQNGIVVLF